LSAIIELNLKDNVYFNVRCGTDQAYELKGFFSCYTPNYKFNPKYKAKMWDGKITFFNIYDRLLPIGLLPKLKEFCKNHDYTLTYNFSMKELRNNITQEDLIPFYDTLFSDGKIYPHDYQQEAIYKTLSKKRGVLEACTSFGKSIVLYTILRYIMNDVDNKILIIVPTINLVNQLYSDMQDYGWEDIHNHVSRLYGDSKDCDLSKKILISTWQSIYKRHDNFFSQYEAVICDETHMCKSLSLTTILKKCVNATYRIGMTGTLPMDHADRYNIFGFIGPLIYQLKSHELITTGFLSDIKIVNMHIKYPIEEIKKIVNITYAEEVKYLVQNEKRDGILKYIIDSKYIKDEDNILVLAQRIEHIKKTVEYLKNLYPNRKILKISGETNPDERESIRKSIDNESGVILVATYGTFSTGISIKKLHHVIFLSFYRSRIKVLQSLGRGLRKHNTKSFVIIWDIVDDMRWKLKQRSNTKNEYGMNYAYLHFLERLKFYDDQKFKYINKVVQLEKL